MIDLIYDQDDLKIYKNNIRAIPDTLTNPTTHIGIAIMFILHCLEIVCALACSACAPALLAANLFTCGGMALAHIDEVQKVYIKQRRRRDWN